MEHLICDVSNFLYELQNTSNTLKVFLFIVSSFHWSLMYGDKFSSRQNVSEERMIGMECASERVWKRKHFSVYKFLKT